MVSHLKKVKADRLSKDLSSWTATGQVLPLDRSWILGQPLDRSIGQVWTPLGRSGFGLVSHFVCYGSRGHHFAKR